MIGEIEAMLEQPDPERTRNWGAVYQCMHRLKSLQFVMGTASRFRGWRLNPRVLVEGLLQEIREINEARLEDFKLQLELLDNDLEKLIVYSLR
jgi:succinate dehydrogenase flavin-adding protein (antitoxin of CptAB toxin-antitoxin module)